ncbi:MAG: bifunctional folylpolyglutamate synthase/dihydrofolate synthase [Deltaproteobacteria bacterium]|nr:bifunctional folylpolyglutamate synthase/dihydrofolate synthase [Deltaproteobacteria bacterium]
MGDPQRDLAVVHVGGTNGKGSACAMLEAIARVAGLRTGLYTSPHLCRFAERIRIDGSPIADEPFARALSAALAQADLTFFETLTVAGLVAMREAEVDLAIVEVGLGGRLDATNVIERPAAAAITSIGLDHTALLGADLASIAREKAAIAKPAVPLVLGPLAPEPAAEVELVAAARGAAPIWRVRPGAAAAETTEAAAAQSVHVAAAEGGRVRISGPGGRALVVRPGLEGPHQAGNAAVAAALGWLLGERWPALPGTVAAGLEAVRWPGRLERIPLGAAHVLLDCAHNPQAAQALRHALEGQLAPARTALIFGALSDKAWAEVLGELAPLAETRYYVEPLGALARAGRSCVPPRALQERWPGYALGDVGRTLAQAGAQARAGDTILVTGSIFLVGAVRAALLGLERDEAIPL